MYFIGSLCNVLDFSVTAMQNAPNDQPGTENFIFAVDNGRMALAKEPIHLNIKGGCF